MKTLRRLCYATLGVAYTHLVFGAIVRISGSGMGCGDNWPKCYGHWFPPFDRPELVIEWTHRLLASLLILSIVGLTTAALLKRREPGVGGRGGVLRPVLAAIVVVLVTAGFGAVTVFLGNPTWATVVHWTLAMTLLAVVTTAAIRAGALGGATIREQQATPGTARAAHAAAAMAFATVVMGGLTAKFPFGSVACQSFPGCGRNAAASDGAVWVQLTHRTIAVLLVLHLIGMVLAGRRRPDGSAIKRAALVAASFGVAQIVIAASMVLFRLPAPLRSLHEAVGVAIWLSTFTLVYLARLARRSEPAGGAEGATLPPHAPAPAADPMPATAAVRATSRGAMARGAESPRGTELGDADATLVVDAAGEAAEARRRRQAAGRRDVVGRSFPTSVAGEVELIEPDEGLAHHSPLSADAVGTAALIAAVERADSSNTPAAPALAIDADATAAELTLVAEVLAALEPSGSLSADRSIGQMVEAAADRSASAELVEASARAVADGIADTLEALHAVAELHAEPADRDEAAVVADRAELRAAAEPAADATLIVATQLEATLTESASVEIGAVEIAAIEAAAPAAPAEPPVAAPPEVLSVAAEVDGQTATAEAAPAPSKPPHTMAVIVARGADL